MYYSFLSMIDHLKLNHTANLNSVLHTLLLQLTNNKIPLQLEVVEGFLSADNLKKNFIVQVEKKIAQPVCMDDE